MVQPLVEQPKVPIAAAKPSAPVPQSNWVAQEDSLYAAWAAKQNGNLSPEDYYKQQEKQGQTLQGVIEVYHRPVGNKPGDYVLLNQATKLPIAVLIYSTRGNFTGTVGQAVSVVVSSRPNNYFAYPAYYVQGSNKKRGHLWQMPSFIVCSVVKNLRLFSYIFYRNFHTAEIGSDDVINPCAYCGNDIGPDKVEKRN